MEFTPYSRANFKTDIGKRTIVYYRCTYHRNTLVFGIQKAWPPPIGARQIDELPKASEEEQLVTKQDPNLCDRVGLKSHKWRQCLWTTEILLTWTLYRNSCSGLEVKRGLKSDSVRSGQPTYEACDDNLDARIYVAPIKFILFCIHVV